MNTLITSLPSSDRPKIAPYSDANCVLSFCKALPNSLVIRVCRLFVDAEKITRISIIFQFSIEANPVIRTLAPLTVEILRNSSHES